MARAIFTFRDQITNGIVDVVEFDLLNNAGVRAWQYAVMLNPPQRQLSQRPIIIHQKIHRGEMISMYQHLQSIIAQLNATDFAWPETLPATVDLISQPLLNALHRHFTNSHYRLWDLRYHDLGNAHINNLLLDLNTCVHKLEVAVPTEFKNLYGNKGQEIWAFNDPLLGFDMFPFRQYHSFDPADLILDAYILGKTLIESFACDDDPSCWDINGHMKTNGGAIALLDNQRSRIYQSQHFQDWLQRHGKTKHNTLADFPLGNFVPGHRTKMESLAKNLHSLSVHVSCTL